jgi:hypothetical protein
MLEAVVLLEMQEAVVLRE